MKHNFIEDIYMHKYISTFYCCSNNRVSGFIYKTLPTAWAYSYSLRLREEALPYDVPIAISTYWRGYLYA